MENSPPDKHLSISTTFGSISIEERSIEAFLAHQDIPDPLSEYDIYFAKYDSNHQLEKKIYLSAQGEKAHLNISGLDQVWFQGKIQQITEFLNSKLEQYGEEQKRIEKDRAVVVEYKIDKISEKYEKWEQIKYFPIKKKDLVDLVNLIVDNNPSDKYFSISTKIDTRSIEGSSIEAFLAHRDVPDPLNKYRIYSAKYDSNHKMENQINLDVGSGSSRLSVSGFDETWVEGRFQQINKFLNRILEQYKEEQKRKEKDKTVTVEYKDKEIIIPETILQKLEHRSLLDKIVAIAVILGTIIAAYQLLYR